MQVTNETQALAHEVLAYWLRFNRHEQETWVGYDHLGFHEGFISKETLPTGAEVNVCQTSLCAAGTAVFLSRSPREFVSFVRNARFFDWKSEGAQLLGLTSDEAELVFLADEKSAKRYMRAIAAGSHKKFLEATKKRRAFDE